MRNYEVVLLIHPDQSEQLASMIEKYKHTISTMGGEITRLEDWGRKALAYPIQKLTKAHYVCLNLACDNVLLTELQRLFKFNDAIIRSMIMQTKDAVTEPSLFMRAEKPKVSHYNRG